MGLPMELQERELRCVRLLFGGSFLAPGIARIILEFAFHLIMARPRVLMLRIKLEDDFGNWQARLREPLIIVDPMAYAPLQTNWHAYVKTLGLQLHWPPAAEPLFLHMDYGLQDGLRVLKIFHWIFLGERRMEWDRTFLYERFEHDA